MSSVDESDNSASGLTDPSTSSQDGGKSSLDSLLSPPPSTLATPILTRDSLSIQDRDSDSFNEVALGDEEAFSVMSTIALSARERVQSTSSVRSFLPSGQTQAHASREPENRADVTEQQHGDDTSILSSPPSGNIPFMLAQLDSPKHRSDFDQVNGHNYTVLDGQQKLQEEFVRTQKQRQEEVDNSGSAGIDWGELMSPISTNGCSLTSSLKTFGVPLFQVGPFIASASLTHGSTARLLRVCG
jgi:hypothetical protein